LNHLKKSDIITEDELTMLDKKFSNGFHVYFQAITGNHNDILFRTSEYIAAGRKFDIRVLCGISNLLLVRYFHNSQITEVNFAKKTV
jgi:hypothetical protein